MDVSFNKMLHIANAAYIFLNLLTEMLFIKIPEMGDSQKFSILKLTGILHVHVQCGP